MNILIINHYAGSRTLGSEMRPWHLAREFEKRGDHVVIVAADYSHKRLKNPVVEGKMEEQQVDGVTYCFFSTPPYENSIGGRTRNIRTFATRLYQEAPRLAERYRPQVVVAASTHPYDSFGARRVAKLAGAALVFELHEVWPVFQMERFRYEKRDLALRMGEFALDYGLKNAHRVVSMLPQGEKYLTARGITLEKYTEIPEAVQLPKKAELTERRRGYLERLRRSYDFLVVYQGYIGEEKHLLPLVEAAKLLEGENIGVLLVGNGGYKINIKRVMRDLGTTNVYLMDKVEAAEKPALCALADCLFFGDSRPSTGEYGIRSSKLLEYMACGRPVLTAMAAQHSPVTLANCGFNTEDATAQGLQRAIREMAALSPGEREEMGRRGVKYLEECHSYDRAAQQFCQVFEAAQKAQQAEKAGK